MSRSPEKLEIARQLGAHLAIRVDGTDKAQQIRAFAGGGVQCVYDCVGTASTMRDGASYVMRGGQIVVIGEEPEFPPIDTIQIAQRELEIIGSRNGSRQDFADAISMLASGIISPPVASRFPLDQINEALQLLRSGQASARIIMTIKE
jgi:threonine dehydrogenase-like Zn-dependent dehydrogenase